MNQFHLLLKFYTTIIFLHLTINSKAQASISELSPGEKKVTIIAKETTLSEVFKGITNQTGLRFSYKNSDVNQKERITGSFVDMSVDRVLKHIFAGRPLSWVYIENIIRIGKSVKEQGPSIIAESGSASKNIDTVPLIDVEGTVVDAQGRAIAGATVTVRGWNKGRGTDNLGNFKLVDIPSNAMLITSSIGYESSQFKVAGQNKVVIKLDSLIREIQAVEIVSTGYQSLPKERATGSFVKIDNETLNAQTGTNILQRLNSVTSGLLFETNKSNPNPQSKTGITIRGLSTINGPLDPLIVLDDFIYEGDLNNINPNTIESITVLKDAAAASIWGARAGNGVIVITSKRGKYNQKPQIDFNANTIISGKPNLYDLSQVSSKDAIEMEEFLFNKGYFNNRINLKYQSLTPAVELFLKRRSGLVSASDSAAGIDQLKTIDTRDQYLKYVYTNSVIQQYALNLRGGSNNHTYVLSAGFDNSRDELYNQRKKLNIKVDNSFRPIKNLEINFGVYYTNSQANSGRNGYKKFSVANRDLTYMKLADDNGNPLSVAHNYRDAYIDTAGANKLLNWRFYPLEDYKHNTAKTDLQELYATLGVKYNLTSFMDIDLRYQYQKQNSTIEGLSDMESFFTRDLINSFSQLNRSTGIVKYIVPLGGIKRFSNAAVESNTFRGQININKNWLDHSISAIVGSEVRQAKNTGNGNVLYGYYEDPLSYGSMDYLNPYPTFVTGEQRYIPGPATLTNTINKFVSFYSNATYIYRNKYILSGSARSDGSNIFGASTNDKWRPLWSAGAGWNISEENFFKLPWISLLKLRTTYGKSGNVDLSRTALPVATVFPATTPSNLPSARILNLNNPSLKWEQTTQWNIGIDYAMLNNRITGSLEYYRKVGTDLYGETPYDYTGWGRDKLIIKNVAAMVGKGIDLQLNGKIINKDLKWNAFLLFNYNTSKTTKYFRPGSTAQNLAALLGGGNGIRPVIGMPLYGVVAYRWGGLDTLGNPQGFIDEKKSTDYLNITAQGSLKPHGGSLVYLGNGSPRYFGSIINSFSFKNVSLTFNISYKFDYYFRKQSINYGAFIEQGGGHEDYEQRWRKRGDELITNVPSFIYPNNSQRDNFYALSEVNYKKGDHIRLQYVNVSYDVIKKVRHSFFPDVRLYANVANLGIIWRANKEGLDPDYPSSLQPVASYTVGVRGNF